MSLTGLQCPKVNLIFLFIDKEPNHESQSHWKFAAVLLETVHDESADVDDFFCHGIHEVTVASSSAIQSNLCGLLMLVLDSSLGRVDVFKEHIGADQLEDKLLAVGQLFKPLVLV